VTLYLTERCNSRCVTCDYWRHGRADMTLESVTRLLPSFARWVPGPRSSRGRALLNPQWQDIVRLLAVNGLKLWLFDFGAVPCEACAPRNRVVRYDYVSMDGPARDLYRDPGPGRL